MISQKAFPQPQSPIVFKQLLFAPIGRATCFWVLTLYCVFFKPYLLVLLPIAIYFIKRQQSKKQFNRRKRKFPYRAEILSSAIEVHAQRVGLKINEITEAINDISRNLVQLGNISPQALFDSERQIAVYNIYRDDLLLHSAQMNDFRLDHLQLLQDWKLLVCMAKRNRQLQIKMGSPFQLISRDVYNNRECEPQGSKHYYKVLETQENFIADMTIELDRLQEDFSYALVQY